MIHRPLSLAIYDFMIEWTQAPWPVDFVQIFGRTGPLVLEAGFGNGDFLVDMASRHPDSNFVGIEISWGSIQRLLRRLDTEGLNNVRVLEGDAGFLVPRVFAPGSLDEVYVNFSDPWRKSRHHRRRLIQTAFTADLWSCLTPGGEVTIATDHAEYADWIADVLEGQDLLVAARGATRVDAIAGRRPTKYESKALARGERIHYFVWNRKSADKRPADDGKPHPNQEAGVMPNVLIEGGLERDRDPWGEETAPEIIEHHRDLEVRIKLTGRYRESRTGNWLITAMVQEGPLTQNFGILLAARPDDRLVLKLAPLGTTRPTWGVKRAVWHAARLLVEQHPRLIVISNTVGDLPPLSASERID